MSWMGLSRRRRNLTVAVATLAGGLIFLVAGALADAGNPILGTIKATAKDNGDGTVTIYVRGQWNWLSHNNDCNFDRAATGAGIIWNDPTEPGYTVSKGLISAGVGISALRAGDAKNTIDQMVHPVDRGNQVEGYTVAGTDYPATQQFVDPSPPGITAAQVAAWKGGCGRQPLSATASKGNPFGEATGLTCANGTVTCADHPWGSWGYEKANGVGKPLGYSHTYEKIQSSGPNAGQSGLPDKVCVNFYDVHGGGNAGNANFQVPNGTKEITVDGNGDNSIETNAFNVNDGANCIAVVSTQTTTDIHNAAHAVVTVVEAGAVVHDFVSVTAPGNPTPTGQVNVDWFTNNTCTGAAAATSANLTLNASGQVDATGFTQGPLAPGLYGFKAHYLGDNGLYLPSDGPCEPLRVVDANIQINPPNATNEVGSPHVLTAHVNVNDGTGFANAPAGTQINFTKVSGPGNLSAASCLTVLATGSCQVTLTSNTAGVTTINAATDVTVGGLILHRATGDAHAGDSANAQKVFVDANIQINPPNATNEVGSPHVLTAHVNVNDGTGFANAPAGTQINFTKVSGPGNLSAASCLTVLATGSCQVTLTSATAGQTVVNAATDVTVGGLILHRATGDAHAGDSANAQKVFVDANIQITPPNATNEVGSPHVLTAHVNVNDGAGFVNAPAGTQINFTKVSGPGNLSAASCLTVLATGSCQVTLTSSTAGVTTINAATDVTVGGLVLHRATGDAHAGDSANAQKVFVDANIQINPPSAINPVSTNHVFTAHVNVNNGAGFANAPAGTTISFTIDSGPGTLSAASCLTVLATGSCSVTLTSATPGTTVVSAHVTVVVGGLSLTRHTNGTGSNSGAATKLFADDTARTDILNAADGVVTSVVAGTIVHDKVFVAKTAATPAAVPNPTGNVIFHRYATIDCTGTATNQTVALTPGSPSTAVSDSFAPTANMSYAAEYLGDANYPARTGACEPLTVTPAPAPAIAIVKNPKSQTAAVGGTATFTITVTNAGNTVLTNVTVTDPLSPNCNRTSAQIPALASMAPGATVTYTCTRPNVRTSFDNVATATGTPPSGPNVTASDTAPVKVAPIAPAKKKVVKKKKPKVVSHKKPKATG